MVLPAVVKRAVPFRLSDGDLNGIFERVLEGYRNLQTSVLIIGLGIRCTDWTAKSRCRHIGYFLSGSLQTEAVVYHPQADVVPVRTWTRHFNILRALVFADIRTNIRGYLLWFFRHGEILLLKDLACRHARSRQSRSHCNAFCRRCKMRRFRAVTTL